MLELRTLRILLSQFIVEVPVLSLKIIYLALKADDL